MRHVRDEYWSTARSSGITVVASSQGVSWIPRAMTTNQTWLITFNFRDYEVRKQIALVAGDRQLYEPMIAALGRREFLWLLRGLSPNSVWRHVIANEPVELRDQAIDAALDSL